AHQQVETSFIEELDTYSSRVAIRANKVATQGKDALQELERWQGAACSEAHLMEMRRVSYSYRYIQEVVYIDNNVPQCSSLEHESPPDTFPVARNYRGAGFRIGKLAFSEFKRDLSGINLIVIDHFTQQLRDFFRGEHGGFKIDRNML
ncbi:CSS-motif domain-containing protein, partial [Escherichia sp. TWPC-MK]